MFYISGGTSSESQLRISLEDLLGADDRGRWWMVGSAWTGRDTDKPQDTGRGRAGRNKVTLAGKANDEILCKLALVLYND